MRIITLLLLLIPSFCYSQVEPKKNDNTIVIQGNNYSIEEFARFLVLEGYEIDKLDKELLYVTTRYKDLSKANKSLYRIKAVIKGSSVNLTGDVKILTNNKRQIFSEEPIYVTPLGTHKKKSFFKILELAEKYAKEKGGEVKTEKR